MSQIIVRGVNKSGEIAVFVWSDGASGKPAPPPICVVKAKYIPAVASLCYRGKHICYPRDVPAGV